MIDPNETPADREKRELFQCYRRGWKHGACANAQDKRFVDHVRAAIGAAYLNGYSNGRDASYLAGAREAERIGYDPRMSILRSAAPVEPPETESEPHG